MMPLKLNRSIHEIAEETCATRCKLEMSHDIRTDGIRLWPVTTFVKPCVRIIRINEISPPSVTDFNLDWACISSFVSCLPAMSTGYASPLMSHVFQPCRLGMHHLLCLMSPSHVDWACITSSASCRPAMSTGHASPPMPHVAQPCKLSIPGKSYLLKTFLIGFKSRCSKVPTAAHWETLGSSAAWSPSNGFNSFTIRINNKYVEFEYIMRIESHSVLFFSYRIILLNTIKNVKIMITNNLTIIMINLIYILYLIIIMINLIYFLSLIIIMINLLYFLSVKIIMINLIYLFSLRIIMIRHHYKFIILF